MPETSQHHANPSEGDFDAQVIVLMLLGWAWPGLGHCFGGKLRRGLMLMACICSLWFIGLLIGGISAVDRYDPSSPGQQSIKLAFFSHLAIAPNLIIDRYVQRQKARLRDAAGGPDAGVGYEPSLARAHEQGVLFISLAGLLNALLLLDLLLPLTETTPGANGKSAAPSANGARTSGTEPAS